MAAVSEEDESNTTDEIAQTALQTGRPASVVVAAARESWVEVKP